MTPFHNPVEINEAALRYFFNFFSYSKSWYLSIRIDQSSIEKDKKFGFPQSCNFYEFI